MGSLLGTLAHKTDQEGNYPYLVDFEGPDDPDLPVNWSYIWRIWVTFAVAILNLIGTVASSIFGTRNEQFMQEFNVSHELAVLGTTLFLVVSSRVQFLILNPFYLKYI